MRRAVVGLALLLSACGTDACPPGFGPAAIATAYFGLGRPGGRPTVTEAEWDAFLADTVTPAFPDGLTVHAADGQWRQDGAVVKEPARVLHLVLPRTSAAAAAARLAPITTAWRDRAQQESVLITLLPSCGRL